MPPRDPLDFPHPCFAPFRDDPDLTVAEIVVAYWAEHDSYFALIMADLAGRKAQGYVVPVPPDALVAELVKLMPPLRGREAQYREWIGVTSGRRAMAWDRARRGDEDGL